ncbi:hypothetical protein L0657_10800 [Dyadobacter sp. CY345]|uniref:hypothetical protein n=1 Tax=Dyadobacter sp. CY345 TaxID=2909335 RepID=UPI001F18A4DC|nr:hypothetical protein [Dyadobacter sp. CY345]MCF2444444.1 hypothetical protein [Dyadobacter sp. CY345]
MIWNESKSLIFLCLLLISSCKDHELLQEKRCQFIGVKSKWTQKYYQTSTTEDYESNLSRNDEDLPEQYTTSRKNVVIDTSDNTEISTIFETHQYLYKYDTQGYLTEFIHTTTNLNKGSDRAVFIHENYPAYKEGSVEVIETTKYQYQDGFLSLELKQIDIKFSSEKTTLKTNTVHSQKSFAYTKDTDGNIAQMTQKTPDGSTETSNYIKGKLTSKVVRNNSGVIGTTSLYDEQGKILSTNFADTKIIYKYDTRGNLLRLEYFYNNSLTSLYENAYDNNPNPELTTITSFKGIVEPFQLLLTNEGVNNLISKKLTNFQNKLTYEESFTYKLNSKGYPETSTSISDSENAIFTSQKTYKYADCD